MSRVSILKGGGPQCGPQTQAWSALPRVSSNTGVAGASWQPLHPPCSTGVLLPPCLCLCCQQCITVGSSPTGARASRGVPLRALRPSPTTLHYISIHMYMFIVSIYMHMCIDIYSSYIHIFMFMYVCIVCLYIMFALLTVYNGGF